MHQLQFRLGYHPSAPHIPRQNLKEGYSRGRGRKVMDRMVENGRGREKEMGQEREGNCLRLWYTKYATGRYRTIFRHFSSEIKKKGTEAEKAKDGWEERCDAAFLVIIRSLVSRVGGQWSFGDGIRWRCYSLRSGRGGGRRTIARRLWCLLFDVAASSASAVCAAVHEIERH